MITREADYAIRTVLYLVNQKDREDIVSTSELAEAMDIPYRFLRRIGGKLADAGLIIGQRGKGGGIQLTEKEENISLLRILDAIDPKNIKINACQVDKNNCSRSGKCSVHNSLNKLQDILNRELDKITFDKLKSGNQNITKNGDRK